MNQNPAERSIKYRCPQTLAEPAVWLAPMAGVTDRPFRMLAREQGGDLSFTEMISAKAVVYGNRQTFRLMDIEGEHPIGVQLFGRCPQTMAEAARTAEQRGATLIDINMGCPVPKVVGNGEGAALMCEPSLAEEIVRRVIGAVAAPVTVKMRAGWNQSTLNAPQLAQRLAAAGISAVTVHGRTRTQMYSGQANWRIIGQVVQAAGIPVIGNGDVWTGEDACALIKQTGCAGVMVARGALGNPWLLGEVRAVFRGRKRNPVSAQAKIEMALRHLKMELAYRGQGKGMLFMRKHLAWYLKGLPETAQLKRSIYACTCPKSLENLLLSYLNNL